MLSLMPGGVICASFCKRVTPNPDVVVPAFLYYYLQFIYDNREITEYQVQSTGLSNFKFEAFLDEQTLRLPTLATQRGIVAILSAYDDLIENNTRRIAILEEMARLLYREWFVEFRFPGHEHLETVDSQIGPIPEGWSCVPYADLLESASGGDWGTEEPTEKDKCAVTVIRGTDFDDVRLGNKLRAPKRYISCQSLERRRLLPGDILVENSVNASSRCVGKSLLITEGALRRMGEDAICASFCKAFRLKNPRLAPLIYLHLRYLYEEGRMAFYQHVATNGIGNFQATRFIESERVSLPRDAELLCQFTSHLADFTSSVYADRASNLRETRDLLLPKLISGELDVEDLDIEEGELSA
jgi:type I restriction enzyme S subunit